MVESGSTTEYAGNGYPFPNWLVYDSSLFEVKVNGRPAYFTAPPPTQNKFFVGRANYDYLGGRMRSDAVGKDTGFNLYVNFEPGGEIPPVPVNAKDTYINGPWHETTEPLPVLDPTKPLYLHRLPSGTMKGAPSTDFDVEMFPQIHCEELGLVLIYDPDYAYWRPFTGEPLHACVIEWRFKELWEIDTSPPFYNLNNFRWSYSNIYESDILNEYISVIPNETDPSKCEVHARTRIQSSVYSEWNAMPKFKGQTIEAWPNLYEQFKNNFAKYPDQGIVRAPIKGDKVGLDNIAIRLNNNPAWLVENTIPDTYSLNNFYNESGYYTSASVYPYVPYTAGTTGHITFTDGINVIEYDANTANWSILSGTDKEVVVELVLRNDIRYVDTVFFGSYREYLMTMENNCNRYIGFCLTNKTVNRDPLLTNAELIAKYINHEYITASDSALSYVPNFEVYDPNDFTFYVNGVVVAPVITYGTNSKVVTVKYPLTGFGGEISINTSVFTSTLSYDSMNLRGQASAPGEFGPYLLDGDRLDNLTPNPDTRIFNRCVPLHIHWEYTGLVDNNSVIPLFVRFEYNTAVDMSWGLGAMDGVYIQYAYTDAGKRGSLSMAPNLTANKGIRFQTLVAKHPRDLIRGWEKSGFTGDSYTIFDFTLGGSKIAFPIIVRPDDEEVVPGESTSATSKLLPYTFESGDMVLDGNFSVLFNSELIAVNKSDSEVATILDSNTDIELVTNEDDTAPSAVGYASVTSYTTSNGADVIITDAYGQVVYDSTTGLPPPDGLLEVDVINLPDSVQT